MKKINRTCQTLCICCENSCAVQKRNGEVFFIESKFQVWGFTDIPCIYDNQCIFRSTGPFIKKNEELKNALIFLAYPNYWRTKYFFQGCVSKTLPNHNATTCIASCNRTFGHHHQDKIISVTETHGHGEVFKSKIWRNGMVHTSVEDTLALFLLDHIIAHFFQLSKVLPSFSCFLAYLLSNLPLLAIGWERLGLWKTSFILHVSYGDGKFTLYTMPPPMFPPGR